MDAGKIPVMIIGTEAEARVALDMANAVDVLVYGFISTVDDVKYKELNDILIVAKIGDKDSDQLLADENLKLVVAEHEIEKRKLTVGQLKEVKAEIINAIHPQSLISPYAKLGRGNIIYSGAVIGPNVLLGSFNLLETYTSIAADAIIGDYCTIQSGVKIGKEVVIGEETFIGMGAIIHTGVQIGSEVMIAAGSVVLQDVPDKATVFGNPARITEAD